MLETRIRERALRVRDRAQARHDRVAALVGGTLRCLRRRVSGAPRCTGHRVGGASDRTNDSLAHVGSYLSTTAGRIRDRLSSAFGRIGALLYDVRHHQSFFFVFMSRVTRDPRAITPCEAHEERCAGFWGAAREFGERSARARSGFAAAS